MVPSVAYLQESQVTLEVVIPQQHHRALMGTKGHKVQRINQDFNVHVKFPERESRDRGAFSRQ